MKNPFPHMCEKCILAGKRCPAGVLQYGHVLVCEHYLKRCTYHGYTDAACGMGEWTKEPPRREGWFWFMSDVLDVKKPICVWCKETEFYYDGSFAWWSYDEDFGYLWWSEEIKPPPLPEGE